MDRNDRALTAFAMLGHATFHTYELVIPIFVGIRIEEFSTTAAFLGVVVGALGSAVAGVVLTRWSEAALFGLLAVLAVLAGLTGVALVRSN